jgi:hypothetical protein
MVPFDALFRYQKTFNESRFLNISLDKYNTNFKNLYTTNGNRYGNQIITVNVQNNKHLSPRRMLIRTVRAHLLGFFQTAQDDKPIKREHSHTVRGE